MKLILPGHLHDTLLSGRNIVDGIVRGDGDPVVFFDTHVFRKSPDSFGLMRGRCKDAKRTGRKRRKERRESEL
jgi:hypothetical protein